MPNQKIACNLRIDKARIDKMYYCRYHKALSAGDSETAEQIANERDARKIKMISRNIKNFEREAFV